MRPPIKYGIEGVSSLPAPQPWWFFAWPCKGRCPATWRLPCWTTRGNSISRCWSSWTWKSRSRTWKYLQNEFNQIGPWRVKLNTLFYGRTWTPFTEQTPALGIMLKSWPLYYINKQSNYYFYYCYCYYCYYYCSLICKALQQFPASCLEQSPDSPRAFTPWKCLMPICLAYILHPTEPSFVFY